MEDIGKCWLVIEKGIDENPDTLLSIISSRRSFEYVRDYMEQLYVDKFASTDEKIRYKKSRSNWPYPAYKQGKYTGNIICGHSPYFEALFCHRVTLEDQVLKYGFKRYMGEKSRTNPVFGDRNGEVKIT
jgi:hypothetical protein